MSGLDLNRLKQYRNEILKAEIGALLFNLGKTHIGFWKEKDGKVYFNVDENSFKNIFGFEIFKDYREYYQKSIFEYELEKFHLDELIKNQKVKFPFQINGKNEIDWDEFFKGNASSEDFIKKIFFRGCENINSGIDKGAPNKQLEPPLWLSNAFGNFKKKIEEKDFDQRRQCFFENLYDFLKEKNHLTNPNWQDIRNFIIKEIKNWYSNLLSDSRFPISDVSLYDQAYMTASMFKAVLSQLIMDKNLQEIKNHKYFQNPSSIKWRILGIQYDKLGLAEKGFKLASISWYREKVKEIDDEIKKLLEIEYPIGNEIYRDETGIYFVVGESLGNDKGNFAELDRNLKNIEEKIINIFDEKLGGEVYPTIVLTKASRGLMNLGYLIENAKENFLKRKNNNVKEFEFDEVEWEDKKYKVKKGKNWTKNEKGENIPNTAIGICPLCKIRLIFEEDKKKNNSPTICEVCDDRIHHYRVENWLKQINKETIWTSEIKDKNDRIALVSLKFELKEWLKGNILNSLLIRENNYEDYFNAIKQFILLFLSQINVEKVLLKDTSIISLLDKEILELKEKLKNPSTTPNEKSKLGKEKGDKERIKKNIEDIINLIKEVRNLKWWEKPLQNKNSIRGLSNLDIDEILEMLKKELSKIESYIKIHSIYSLNPFSILAKDAYYGCKKNNESFNDFVKQIFFGSIVGTQWEDWIKQTPLSTNIDWGNEKIEWDKFKDENDPALDILANLLLQFLLRKNPSPARLRRIWETTQDFFENIKTEVLDENKLSIPEWRRKRIVFEVDYSEELKEKLKETGEELEGNRLLFWAHPDENKTKVNIYLISSIEDFIEKYGKDDIVKKLRKNELEEISKSDLNIFKIELKKFSEREGKGKGEVLLTLENKHIKKFLTYNPYASIIDPTPVGWQVIIPAEYTSKFIDLVMERYNHEFKYVYGKLPIHIGVIVQNYKKPLYVGINALRRIRRDVKDIDKLYIQSCVSQFCIKQRKKISLATPEEHQNLTEKYYSLYWNNPNNQDYNFYIKPNRGWKKWISTVDKYSYVENIEVIPNTFDFEFLDSNTRRNDIFYEEEKGYKRAFELKSNRPYEIEEYWGKFKAFKELFKEKINKAKLHKLVSLFYEKLQNNEKDLNPLLASAIINILNLRKDKEAQRYIQTIFDLEKNKEIFEELKDKLNKEKIKLFIDMFEFWHTALKEV